MDAVKDVITTVSGAINESLSQLMNKFIIAILILFVGFIIGKVLGRLIQRLLEEAEINTILQQATKKKLKIDRFLGSFVTYFIYFITVVLALNQLGLITTILNFLSVVILIVIAASFFLFVKDLIPNITAGIYLFQKKHFTEGDYIKLKNTEGQIEEMNLIEIKIKTQQGDLIFVPNAILANSEVVKLKRTSQAKK